MNKFHNGFIAILLISLMGCSGESPSHHAEAPMAPASEMTQSKKSSGEAGGEMDRLGDDGERTRAPDKRMVIREATVELRADTPVSVATEATKIVERAGGFVVNSDATGSGEDVTRIDVTLRVPADRFEPTLAELRQLGVVLREHITGQDVTEEFMDLEARMKAKRQLESRFLGLLQNAQNVEDTLKIEQELARVRTEIERMEGRSRFLEDRVNLSTIRVTATSPHRPSDPQSESFGSVIGRAFSDSAELFVDVCAGIIRVVGALLPVGMVLGIFGGGFFVIIRWVVRRRKR